jgi:biotin transport system substrate-specific component
MTTANPALTTPRYLTLSEALFPQRTLFRDIGLVLAGVLFFAATAQVSIKLPIGPVPISGITVGVLMVGGLLGARLGTITAVAYLALGLIGLPVWSGQVAAEGFKHTGDFSYGWMVMTGATGGYLLSYPFVAGLVGALAERGWDRHPLRLSGAMLLGSVLIYAFGLPWLYGWGETNPHLSGVDDMTVTQTLKWGLLPFIPGDIAKLLLTAGVLPAAWHLLHALHLREQPPEAAPAGMRLVPLGIAAGVAVAASTVLPWSGGALGIEHTAGVAVLVAGVAGASNWILRSRGVIGGRSAALIGFAAGALAAVLAFVRLVEFTATGELGLAPVEIGVPVAVVFSIVLLATTASGATARE